MNGYEARKLDKGEMYVDLDEDTDLWCVFGSESGFAYQAFSTEEEADEWLSLNTPST